MREIRIPLKLELGIERAIREAAKEAFAGGVRAQSVVAYIDPQVLQPAAGLLPAPDAALGLKRTMTDYGLVDVRFGPGNCLVVVPI